MDWEEDLVEEDDSDDEVEWSNYIAKYYLEEPPYHRWHPLVPDNVEDDMSRAIQFLENFSLRYGNVVPIFFPGSLKDAMDETFVKPDVDDEVKPLLIYLHNDKSICCNVFCSQVLCSELVFAYLSQNFIIWGWDMTQDSNHCKLLQALECNFDDASYSIIKCLDLRRLPVDTFPLLLVVTRDPQIGDTDFDMISGKYNEEETMAKLMDGVDRHRRHVMAAESAHETKLTDNPKLNLWKQINNIKKKLH